MPSSTVGSTSRLSDSHMSSGGATPRAPPWKRADMTGQRGPRHAVARPTSTIATAPARAAARQGAPSGGSVHEIVIAGPGRVIMAGAAWRAAAVAGAVAIVLAGLATVWRGPRWPVMSARFQRGTGGVAPPTDMWESLSRDVDPTADDGTRT